MQIFFDFIQKVALVIGAASGIGWAAEFFVKCGAKFAVNYSSNSEQLIFG